MDAGRVLPERLDADDRATLQRACAAFLERGTAVTDAVSADILARQPELVAPDSPDALAAVYRATDANVRAIVSTLAGGVQPDSLDVPEGALDLLDFVAVEPEALPVMLRAYRLGAADFTQIWLTALADHVDDVARYALLARYSYNHTARYVDRISEVLVGRWTSLIETAARSGRRRRATLLALLDGATTDTASLDHPFDQPQLLVGTRAADRAHGHAAAVARALDLHGPAPRLTVDLPEDVTLHCIALAAPPAPGAVARTLDAAPADGWTVATIAEPGTAPVIQAARDIRLALRVMPTVRPGGSRSAYGDIALLCALLSDRRDARRTARAILGPLAEPTARARRLRSTLRAYYDAGERKVGAAATLGVHEKTIGHRLRQVEDLLGSDFYARRTELDVALLIERTIGLD